MDLAEALENLKCPSCGSTDVGISITVDSEGEHVSDDAVQIVCESCDGRFALNTEGAGQSASTTKRWWQFWE